MASSCDNSPIILASASPRRIDLLRQVGLDFSAVSSDIEECSDASIPTEELVERNALAKARDVARQFEKGLVLGADTVVVCEGKLYEKPSDIGDARRMLYELAGRTHKVYSGVAALRIEDESVEIAHAVTEVTFRQLSEPQITRYFEMINPLDKAGAYAIQGAGGIIIEKIKGCYYNVVGLPLAVLDDLLTRFDVRLL